MLEKKHRIIWEQAHGAVPKKHRIVFADGNKRNFDIDNLVCVSMENMLTINQMGLKYYDAESLKSAVLIAKIKSAAYKRKD